MKNRVIPIIYIFLCILFLCGFRSYSQDEREKIISLMRPSPVIAEIIKTTPTYNSNDETSGRIGMIYEGTLVEIIQDRSSEWYKVREMGKQESVWVKRDCLKIPPDETPCDTMMTKDQLEGYMNIMGFESKTKYFVLTDIYRQVTHIFKGGIGDWKLEKTMDCSTGRNQSPTTRGLFKIKERGEWFYSERLGSGSMYWVRFNGSYLFHSVAMDKSRTIIDNVIGDRRSMGCIRLRLNDARWFYMNVPEGTTVFIN